MGRGRHVEARPRRLGRWPMLLLVLTMVGATAAVADTHTVEPDVFHGCLTPGGQIVNVARNLSTEEAATWCNNAYWYVTWNETGPEGPQGSKVRWARQGYQVSLGRLGRQDLKANRVSKAQ